MSDRRVRNHAKILVRYSIAAESGQTVGVSGEAAAEPLIAAVYEELLRTGAFPVISMSPRGVTESLFRFGKPHHFSTATAYQKAYVRLMDSTIRIRAASNTRELSSVSPRKQATLAKTMRPLSNVLLSKAWTDRKSVV